MLDRLVYYRLAYDRLAYHRLALDSCVRPSVGSRRFPISRKNIGKRLPIQRNVRVCLYV